MRVISKFRDYYDSVQAYGVDPKLVYLRATESERVLMHEAASSRCVTLSPVFREILGLPFSLNRDWEYVDVLLIGFCGQLYPAFRYHKIVYHTLQKLLSQASDQDRKHFEVLFNQKTFSWDKALTYASWEEATKDLRTLRYDDVFVSLGVPVFCVELNPYHRIYEITLNPNLKNLNFQAVKTPVEAYQEIAMFLGNQLAQQKDPVPVIDDDTMRDKKGFDKWSFRRHKDQT
jgi:hypothetical protein